MANAIKKPKLLPLLTTASASHPPPSPPPQQFPTPPASPQARPIRPCHLTTTTTSTTTPPPTASNTPLTSPAHGHHGHHHHGHVHGHHHHHHHHHNHDLHRAQLLQQNLPPGHHAQCAGVLRTARAALHASQSSCPASPLPSPSTTMRSTQCLLPGGFMVLTPVCNGNCNSNSNNNNSSCCTNNGITVTPPQSPPTRGRNYSSRLPLPASQAQATAAPPPAPPKPYSPPAPQQSAAYPPQKQRQRTPPRAPHRLTREAVGKIGKDSRLARWERVLFYVREQRSATLPAATSSASGNSASEGVAWAAYAYGATTTPTSPTGPSAAPAAAGTPTPAAAAPPTALAQQQQQQKRLQERKRRREELAAIEACNAALDALDRSEQDNRSLWSGGTGGTNAVDEFVWSEDEDDEGIVPMPSLPPPLKVVPGGVSDDEGVFDMVLDDPPPATATATATAQAGAGTVPTEGLMRPPTRTSTPSTKRPRPKSSPVVPDATTPVSPVAGAEDVFQRSCWSKRIVEEALCRERERDGGLGRLVGRRVSAAY